MKGLRLTIAKQTVSSILDTLGDDDFFNIIAVSVSGFFFFFFFFFHYLLLSVMFYITQYTWKMLQAGDGYKMTSEPTGQTLWFSNVSFLRLQCFHSVFLWLAIWNTLNKLSWVWELQRIVICFLVCVNFLLTLIFTFGVCFCVPPPPCPLFFSSPQLLQYSANCKMVNMWELIESDIGFFWSLYGMIKCQQSSSLFMLPSVQIWNVCIYKLCRGITSA